MMAPCSSGKELQTGQRRRGHSDRVMSVYTVFVAATFNLMVTVRVTGQFTGAWVTNREHFDTKPKLEATTELLIMEVEA